MIVVDTVATLERVQQALRRAEETQDDELRRDAESVLSAIVLVLRHRRVKLPDEVKNSLTNIS